MFYYLNGTVALLEAGLAVIDCGGVGYACHTTATTLSKLHPGQKQMLYTYCHVKEDAFDIYGFASKEELSYFALLLGVSGVGPKAAISILSAMTPDRLSLAIMTGDEKLLTTANGVGKKMAQRVILELKDKVGKLEEGLSLSDISSAAPASRGKASEASAALAALGYSQSEIGQALKGLDVDGLPVEEIVRKALKNMLTN